MKEKLRTIFLSSSVSLLCFTSKVSAAGLEVQTSDVITVVKNCIPYVIGMLAVIIIAIAVAVAAKKQEEILREMHPRNNMKIAGAA